MGGGGWLGGGEACLSGLFISQTHIVKYILSNFHLDLTDFDLVVIDKWNNRRKVHSLQKRQWVIKGNLCFVM